MATSLWAPIQNYINHQKNLIPLETAYLYQSGYLGSPLNQSLRNGVLTSTLHNMYLDLISCFNRLPSLETEVVVFRCIPMKDIPNYEIGDVISDPAFDSVSLKRDACTYFGDVLFTIHLGRNDKLIALTQHQWFLEDIYECILPPGMQYKVTSKENVMIKGNSIPMYTVVSIGHKEPIFEIDMDFDDTFHQLGKSILDDIDGNIGKSRLNHKAILVVVKQEDASILYYYFTNEYELTSHVNLDNLCEEKKNSPIFRLIYLYTDLLDGKVISLHPTSWFEAKERSLNQNLEGISTSFRIPHLRQRI